MKVFYLSIALALALFSCNSDSSNHAATPTAQIKNPQTADPEANNIKKVGGVVVEKTVEVPEAPVDDSGVDYNQLAASICQCADHLRGHDHGESSNTQIDPNDKEFAKEVDCAKAAKANVTKGEISRQSLVQQLKGACPDLPGKYVALVVININKTSY